MTINVKYFGMLAEKVQANEEHIAFSGTTISELVDLLCERHAELSSSEFQIAQQQCIVQLNDKVTGAEIALLPPFSGG